MLYLVLVGKATGFFLPHLAIKLSFIAYASFQPIVTIKTVFRWLRTSKERLMMLHVVLKVTVAYSTKYVK
jgi:hypothetical protein